MIQQHTAITQPAAVVGSQPMVSIEPVPLLPSSLEPVALLLVLGLFVWMLARILRRRRRQPPAWPVPSLLGLEASSRQTEPANEPLCLPGPVLLDDELASLAADAEAAEEEREEELELVT